MPKFKCLVTHYNSGKPVFEKDKEYDLTAAEAKRWVNRRVLVEVKKPTRDEAAHQRALALAKETLAIADAELVAERRRLADEPDADKRVGIAAFVSEAEQRVATARAALEELTG